MEENINPTQPVKEGNGLAVAALVLGILGIVLIWLPVVNWLIVILAIIFGALGMKKPAKKGMAKAGLILGIIDIILLIVFKVVGLSLIMSNM